jgi:KUP system potassium uptake protein
VQLSAPNVLGVLSLIIWSLIVVITIKYVLLMLRADNRGEGGVLALSTLLGNATRNWRLWEPVAAAGLLGAALFFGDGILTPAISVLSAVEGLVVLNAQLQDYVVPVTLAILTVLFAVQRHGTGAVGRLFGPVIIVWFVVLGLLGLTHALAAPAVLAALNPVMPPTSSSNGWQGFRTLSAVFLASRAAALYADIGHFGLSTSSCQLVLPA